jgi:hypothetical protein
MDSHEGGDLLGSFESFTDPSPGPEEQAIILEIRTKLSGCIRQILQIDQEIFWMRERGLAYKEITETLGLPHGTVASKYHRAKEALASGKNNAVQESSQTRARAHQIYRGYLQKIPNGAIEEHRKIELERIADLRARLWAEMNGRPGPKDPCKIRKPAPR